MSIEKNLPKQIMFSLRELQDLGFMRISTAKKIINLGNLQAVKVGVKLFVLRDEVVRYYEDNVVKATPAR